MEQNTITIEYPGFEKKIISWEYKEHGLVECVGEPSQEGDNANISYDISGLTCLKDFDFAEEEDKLRVLYYCGALARFNSKYDFAISPENIYLDINLNPYILSRMPSYKEETSFTEEYKALIASLLFDKYSYENYINGGADLYEKDKRLRKMFSSHDDKSELNGIIDELYTEYITIYEKNKTTLVKTDRKKDKLRKILIPVLSTIIALLAIGWGINYFVNYKLSEDTNRSYEAFLVKDYIKVQEELKDYDISRFSYMTKYELSYSYLMTSNLSTVEREAELARITPVSEEILFEYWINIGRGDYEEAIENAQRLNSNSHLFYAYVCYRDTVRTDLTMDGNDKDSLLQDLDSKIDSLVNTLNESQG